MGAARRVPEGRRGATQEPVWQDDAGGEQQRTPPWASLGALGWPRVSGVTLREGALAIPNYRTFMAGSTVALSGGWLLRTAQAWLVLDLTGSPAALGAVTVAQALPVTLLTLFAGVVIDRMPMRRLMISAQVIFVAQAAITAILVLSHTIQFWHVLVLASVMGVASAVDFPTRSAIISELVDPARVANGVAVYSSVSSATRIVGPGIGGVMIALWGSGACFAVTAAAFAVATSSLLLLRPDQFYPRRRAARGAVVGQLVAGLRYAVTSPLLAYNVVLAAFIGTFAYNWALALPLLARYALQAGAEGFGALNMAMGLGSTLGALWLASRVAPSARLVLGAAAVFSLLILVVAQAASMPVALVLLVATGAASIAFNASSNTLLQINTREEFRGRVLSFYMFLMIGTTPLGGAFTGLVANQFDVRVALEINGALCLVGVAVATAVLRRAEHTAGWLRAEAAPARLD